MTRNSHLIDWHPASWHDRPATQQPTYADPEALSAAVGESVAVDSRLIGVGVYRNLGQYFVLRADLVHIEERRPSLPTVDGYVAVVELGVQF